MQQPVLRHTSRRCEERQHMYRKGGRGTHQEHWNPQRCGRNHYLPILRGKTGLGRVSTSTNLCCAYWDNDSRLPRFGPYAARSAT